MQTKKFKSTVQRGLSYDLSRPPEHAVSGASPSKDSKNPSSHKDQGRTAAVSLGIKVNSGICHTQNCNVVF